MYLKSQMFPSLETREGRQKIWEGTSDCQMNTVCLTERGYQIASWRPFVWKGISDCQLKTLCLTERGYQIASWRPFVWEGISDCQLKTVCLTEDGDFWARTADSKQRIPQLFWLHSARRAKFSACAVALLVFVRFSEGYFHGCSFCHVPFRTVKTTWIWNARRMLITEAGNIWSCTVIAFLDFE